MKETNIMIREMLLHDCKAVTAIDEECILNPWYLSDFEHALERDENHYWVAVLDEEIIGFAGVMTAIDETDIIKIAVLPKYRGKHYGMALLQQIISYAQRDNLCAIHLEVREHNTPARCLYQQMGFEELGVRKKYYNNPVEDAIIMIKHL